MASLATLPHVSRSVPVNDTHPSAPNSPSKKPRTASWGAVNRISGTRFSWPSRERTPSRWKNSTMYREWKER